MFILTLDQLSPLQDGQLIPQTLAITSDERPSKGRRIMKGELAESVVLVVEDSGDVQKRLPFIQGAVTLYVAGHAINEVGHRLPFIGKVRVIVNNG